MLISIFYSELKFADIKWSINTFELIYIASQQIPYTAISGFILLRL